MLFIDTGYQGDSSLLGDSTAAQQAPEQQQKAVTE